MDFVDALTPRTTGGRALLRLSSIQYMVYGLSAARRGGLGRDEGGPAVLSSGVGLRVVSEVGA